MESFTTTTILYLVLFIFKKKMKNPGLTLSFLGAEMIEEPPTPYLQLVYTVVSKSGRRVSLTGMTEKEMRSYAHDIVIAIKMLTEKEVRTQTYAPYFYSLYG